MLKEVEIVSIIEKNIMKKIREKTRCQKKMGEQ